MAWGLPAVSREVHAWRARAHAIPDATLREDALGSLTRKRGHTDGAALLSTIPKARHGTLLRLLVAYEIVWDFLDGVNERGAPAGQVNGEQLHLALLDAVDISRPLTDYYRHHLADDDGRYLTTLVEACRAGCRTLVSYAAIRPLLTREARNAQVLAINHDLDPRRRDADLQTWAAGAFPGATAANWFELSGAASASLTIHALFALGAQPCDSVTLERVTRAYFPWISAATTMLDSYVDQVEDRFNGDHSYVSHYRAPAQAVTRIGELIVRSFEEIRALRDGERHAVIVACMIAMYLAKDSVRANEFHTAADDLIRAGGSLTRLLRPILRMWRVAYSQRPH